MTTPRQMPGAIPGFTPPHAPKTLTVDGPAGPEVFVRCAMMKVVSKKAGEPGPPAALTLKSPGVEGGRYAPFNAAMCRHFAEQLLALSDHLENLEGLK